MVGIVPLRELNKGIVETRDRVVLLFLVMFLLAECASFWLAARITRPIRTLTGLMKQVEQGNYTVRIHLDERDEIGLLGKAFNKMSRRIDELVNQVLEARFQHTAAELNHLKLQIRPHFLYNTLESIRALAEIDNSYKVAQMTSALGALFRYSISTQDEWVALDKELDHARHYLTIQTFRLGNAFRAEVEVPPAGSGWLTIPFILQPIIENAFIHGLSSSGREGVVSVAVREAAEHIVICVADNGIGMDEGETARLNDRLLGHAGPTVSPSAGGLGLANVSRRLQLLCGESGRIWVESVKNTGTRVFIRMPKKYG